MAYTFQKYGTFTGPGVEYRYRDNDDFSNIFDGGFNLSDVSMCLINTESPSDYVYMHLAGTSTASVTLEASYGPIPTFTVNATNSYFSGNIIATGTITAPAFAGAAWSSLVANVNSKKSFDISHPSKDGWRLRYICLEGPEAEVYHRGKLVDSTVIELPEYWKDLVDLETIGVTLTPIGSYQELFVEKIMWGTKIIVKNNAGGAINCSYVVYGERKDVEKNITEYEGQTPLDYPGDNSQYVINGKPA
jgi:hypothetical protein